MFACILPVLPAVSAQSGNDVVESNGTGRSSCSSVREFGVRSGRYRRT